jgi:hypothetical protein
VSKRDRRDGDRSRDDRRDDRRDGQPEDEQQRRMGESDAQEGESLTALKGILAKVASLLKPLQLNPEESIRLVEQLYGNVLEMDSKLAGESDETRKSSVLAHIQNTVVRREGDKLVVEYPVEAKPEGTPSGKARPEAARSDGAKPEEAKPLGAPAETRPAEAPAETRPAEAPAES